MPPSTGKTFHSFRIAYSRCGTKPDLNGQFYENTVKFLALLNLLAVFSALAKSNIKSIISLIYDSINSFHLRLFLQHCWCNLVALFCRSSFNTIKICSRSGTRRSACDVNGSMTMRKRLQSRRWSLPTWTLFSLTSEVKCSTVWLVRGTHFLLILAGDNVDCWMEIQHGKGPWAPPVSGIVPLGSTLTLVVAINDFRGMFRSIKILASQLNVILFF